MFGLNLSIQAIWLFSLVAIPAVFFVRSRFKGDTAAWIVLINALFFTVLSIPSFRGSVQEFSIQAGSFLGEIPVRIDALSAWFILIINFTAVTGAFYGTGYLKAYSQESAAKLTLHWVLFILFHLSMVWVCMLQHGFAFLLAWEIMSLSSMLLVIFDHTNPKIIKAGINYLVQMHLSVVFLTIGFIWVYCKTGSFDFSGIQMAFSSGDAIWLFLLFFTGFGLKAGFLSLHTWLPHAHPAAPSHISGVMSGVIVKLGIYGIFRMISFLTHDFVLLGELILTLSVCTGLYGILNASVHRDFKSMLAYCTIENIGIIGIGTGVGLMGIGTGSSLMFYLGFGGALMHVLNHSLFKSLLFYSAGSVFQQTHTRDMDRLGGLIRRMPRTALLFLTGALAVAGLPPLNGFISEFIIYGGLLEGIRSENLSEISLLVLSFAGLSLIGGLSILAFSKSFGTIFLGNPREAFSHLPGEVSSRMLIPQYMIVGVMISIVLFPMFYMKQTLLVLEVFSHAFPLQNPSVFLEYAGTAARISLCSVLFVGVAGLCYGVRYWVTGAKDQPIRSTWGCAYTGPATKMQYTGKSFSKPLSKIFNFVLIEKKRFEELRPGEIFPEKRQYSSHYLDFFEQKFFNPWIQRIIYIPNYFKFIQNGRMQSYVLYGIVFIFTLLILSVLNIL